MTAALYARGDAMVGFVETLAQFECALRRERVQVDLDRTRARGVRVGRTPKPVDLYELKPLRAAGRSVGQLARHLHGSRPTIRRRLRTLPPLGSHPTGCGRAEDDSPPTLPESPARPAMASRRP